MNQGNEKSLKVSHLTFDNLTQICRHKKQRVTLRIQIQEGPLLWHGGHYMLSNFLFGNVIGYPKGHQPAWSGLFIEWRSINYVYVDWNLDELRIVSWWAPSKINKYFILHAVYSQGTKAHNIIGIYGWTPMVFFSCNVFSGRLLYQPNCFSLFPG